MTHAINEHLILATALLVAAGSATKIADLNIEIATSMIGVNNILRIGKVKILDRITRYAELYQLPISNNFGSEIRQKEMIKTQKHLYH